MKSDEAKNLFKSGLNCSQSVFCAFAEEFGLSEEFAQKISCALGGGVGRMRETCGAVTGAALVIGLKTGPDKVRSYAKVQEFCAAFKKEFGSIVCRELLNGVNASVGGSPEERTKEYYQKRPCAEMVAKAAEILEKMDFA
jgi:C_GCAxxG_C_C family probable redox protein